MAKKAATKERSVLVTTEYRGVFFGWAENTDGDTIKLRAARNVTYWPAQVKGIFGAGIQWSDQWLSRRGGG